MFPVTRPADWTVLHSIDWQAAGNSFRWWRIDVSDGANPDGKFRAGRAYIAKAFQPAKNLIFNWPLGWIDDSLVEKALGGQLYPLERPPRRSIDFALSSLTEAEAFAEAFEFDRLRGNAKDVLAIRDPDATTYLHTQTIYGLMTGFRPIINRAFDLYEKTYRIEELLP